MASPRLWFTQSNAARNEAVFGPFGTVLRLHQSAGESTGLMSTTGLPSTASNGPTLSSFAAVHYSVA